MALLGFYCVEKVSPHAGGDSLDRARCARLLAMAGARAAEAAGEQLEVADPR